MPRTEPQPSHEVPLTLVYFRGQVNPPAGSSSSTVDVLMTEEDGTARGGHELLLCARPVPHVRAVKAGLEREYPLSVVSSWVRAASAGAAKEAAE